MKITSTIKLFAASLASLVMSTGSASAQAFTENFDNITTLSASGWLTQNNSTPVGTIPNWFQGTNVAGGGPWDAYNGAANAYVAANYNFVTGNNMISGWMVTPNRTIKNGDVLSFYARSSNSQWSDRLQVRLSTNGASTNVGTTASAVGDFSTLLLDINPTEVQGVFLNAWTLYTVTVSGLAAPTSGRFAFRYFVTSGGPSGADSDYIGIDNVVYTPYVCPAITVTPSSLSNGTAGITYSQPLSQTGALGTHVYAVTAGALPTGLSLSTAGVISGTPSATGIFNFTVSVVDASGCSGSQSYSITVGCPANPTALALSAVCSNAGLIALTGGSPAGGTYSGTGVSAGMFDPTAGSQTITYSYTDVYSCVHTTSETQTVNAAPAVTLPAFTAVCDNNGVVTLSGGSPAGGTYTGTNVSAGNFDPSGGTQTITYTYSDGTCSSTASEVFSVNASPSVTLAAFTPVCDNNGMVTLAGGSPAGGNYSGIGVSAGDFDPSTGTQSITYTYSDGTCSNAASEVFTVNTAPAVTMAAFTSVPCINSPAFALTGGSPAGGSYSGTNVSTGMFDPIAAGTFVITYTYSDGTCSNSDTASVMVDVCTGISEQTAFGNLNVFPNPGNGLITVQFVQANGQGKLVARVLDVQGRVVAANEASFSGSYLNAFDLTNASAGVYFLEIRTENVSMRSKLIIQ